MFPVDNLYVLDVEGNENTLNILEYFKKNIQKYNKLMRRKIRVYRITDPMIKGSKIVDALEMKTIYTLPALEIFTPQSGILSGVDEITTFMETLFKSKLSRATVPRPPDSQAVIEQNPEEMYQNFMQSEMTGKENELDVNTTMATQISDRYRTVMEGRNTSTSHAMEVHR